MASLHPIPLTIPRMEMFPIDGFFLVSKGGLSTPLPVKPLLLIDV